MEVFTHFFVFFLGLSMSFILRYGLARSPDNTEDPYFVSASITFKDHKGRQIERYYTGSFTTKSHNPDEMARDFKDALVKLLVKETPEEVFQLSDKNNYSIRIYSMNKV